MEQGSFQRVNIALVALNTEPLISGAGHYTHDLAVALATQGHGVTLLCQRSGGDTKGATTIVFGNRTDASRGKLTPFIEALEAHLRQNRYGIVHAMVPVPWCDLYHPHGGVAAEAATGGEMKEGGRRSYVSVERELLANANPPTVLCVSDLVRQTVRRHYRLPEGKLAKLFNAIDLEMFNGERRPGAGLEIRQRSGIAPDRIVALIVAQDFERKGLHETIHATAQLNDERLVLLVVGGQDPGRYKAQAAIAGVKERVIFAGATSDPYAFYQAADFFVMPTRHDPCSLAVLESLAMGVPVISTVQNGACEIMTHGTHGFVLPDPADVGALADAMRRMLDPGLRGAMAAACRELRPQMSYEHHLRALLAIYRRLRRTSDAQRI